MVDNITILIWLAVILIISVALCFLPSKTLSIVTYPFSFKTFGIRKQKKLNSTTDTVGNTCLLISVIFCIVYPFIPYFWLIYAIWLTFSWLCALARVPRMSEVKVRSTRQIITFFITLMFGCGLISSLGIFDGQQLILYSRQFALDVLHNIVFNIMYPLTHAAIICWLAQGLLMMIPLYALWSQFKYMRVENTYKGRTLFGYGFRNLFLILIVLFLGIKGSWGIKFIYQVPDEVEETVEVETEETPEVIEAIEEDIELEQEETAESEENQN